MGNLTFRFAREADMEKILYFIRRWRRTADSHRRKNRFF